MKNNLLYGVAALGLLAACTSTPTTTEVNQEVEEMLEHFEASYGWSQHKNRLFEVVNNKEKVLRIKVLKISYFYSKS